MADVAIEAATAVRLTRTYHGPVWPVTEASVCSRSKAHRDPEDVQHHGRQRQPPCAAFFKSMHLTSTGRKRNSSGTK